MNVNCNLTGLRKFNSSLVWDSLFTFFTFFFFAYDHLNEYLRSQSDNIGIAKVHKSRHCPDLLCRHYVENTQTHTDTHTHRRQKNIWHRDGVTIA